MTLKPQIRVMVGEGHYIEKVYLHLSVPRVLAFNPRYLPTSKTVDLYSKVSVLWNFAAEANLFARLLFLRQSR